MVGLYNSHKYSLILNLKSETMIPEKLPIYKSFLVRIWGDETGQMWRIMVVRISEADERHYFTTLDDLMIFLLQEIEILSKGERPMT